MLPGSHAEATAAIDAPALAAALRARGLKQWWVAEQLGVSPRTVLRWVNGQVTRMQNEHRDKLAALLACEAGVFTRKDAVSDDRVRAAQVIDEQDLMERLTPSSSYPLAETLMRTALSPDLPPKTRGKLQVHLARAAVRQFALDRALEYAREAESLGERLGDDELVAQARLQAGWASFYSADMRAAERSFAGCVETFARAGLTRDEGDAAWALGAVYGYLGEPEKATAFLERGIARLAAANGRIELSMALYVRGCFALEAGDLATAEARLRESLAVCVDLGYVSGREKARAALALHQALAGDVEGASAAFAAAYAGMRGEAFVHPVVHLQGARIEALAGRYEAALRLIEEAAPFAARYKGEDAALARAKHDYLRRLSWGS